MRQRVPDKEKAKSLIKSAKRDFEYTLTLSVSNDSANTIVRNIYESFRMLGEALLVIKGISFIDHIECINELINLNIETERPIRTLDYLRRIRHRINYDGYMASEEEAKEIISVGKSLFKKIYDGVKEKIR